MACEDQEKKTCGMWGGLTSWSGLVEIAVNTLLVELRELVLKEIDSEKRLSEEFVNNQWELGERVKSRQGSKHFVLPKYDMTRNPKY